MISFTYKSAPTSGDKSNSRGYLSVGGQKSQLGDGNIQCLHLDMVT